MITSFKELNPLRPIIHQFGLEIDNHGVSTAMESLTSKIGTKVLVNEVGQNLREVLDKKPVLVVANHPAEADVIALLASLSNRKDLFLIINSCFLNICPNLDKHLIPVYISHHLIRKGRPNFRFRLFRVLHKFSMYNESKEHELNIKSINKAGKKLKNGGMVVMFPGGGGEGGRWFSGIGHLLNQAKENLDIHIVRAYIEGTSDKDYLRLIPGLARLMHPFKVSLSCEKYRYADENAKDISQRLESDYKMWVKSITNNWQGRI